MSDITLEQGEEIEITSFKAASLSRMKNENVLNI